VKTIGFGPLVLELGTTPIIAQLMEKSEIVGAFEALLRAKGVFWAEDAVEVSQANVVHGFGVMAKREIKAGELLFRVPKKACFGAGLLENAAELDSQKDIALLMLQELNIGVASDWKGFLQLLPESHSFDCVPWVWPNCLEVTKGTELEGPVQAKLLRLRKEFQDLGSDCNFEFETYVKTCGVVISHLNPFFGGSMAPFATLLNCHNQHDYNVEFEEIADEIVVGKAVKLISARDELFQPYGNLDSLSNAELFYRCGFSLQCHLPNDVVSFGKKQYFTSLHNEKFELLAKADVFQESPWDGVEDFTIEVNAALDGLFELVFAVHLLELPQEAWQEFLGLVEAFRTNFEGEDIEDESDKVAICCAASFDQLQGNVPNVKNSCAMSDGEESVLERHIKEIASTIPRTTIDHTINLLHSRKISSPPSELQSLIEVETSILDRAISKLSSNSDHKN